MVLADFASAAAASATATSSASGIAAVALGRGMYVKIKSLGGVLSGSLSAVSKPNLKFLQENIRWKALDEIYKIYMLLHRADLNISEKCRQTFFAFLGKTL